MKQWETSIAKKWGRACQRVAPLILTAKCKLFFFSPLNVHSLTVCELIFICNLLLIVIVDLIVTQCTDDEIVLWSKVTMCCLPFHLQNCVMPSLALAAKQFLADVLPWVFMVFLAYLATCYAYLTTCHLGYLLGHLPKCLIFPSLRGHVN